MSCVPVYQHFESSDDTDDPLSWANVAGAVRNHALSLPPNDADALLKFADLLEGFADLEKR